MPTEPQYLWVMAPSGCGKTTAVTDCVAKPGHRFRERLGIKGRRIRMVNAGRDGEKSGEKMLIFLAEHYAPKGSDVVLIDGQWPDVLEKTDTIRKWRDAHPEVGHLIIWLNCAPKEAARRIRKYRGTRPNAESWEKTYSTAQATDRHREMVACVERLMKQGIEVHVLDSSSNDYAVSDWEAVRQHCNPKRTP